MPNPDYIIRRLPSSEASLLLDDLFLRFGAKTHPISGGEVILSPSGDPLVKILPLETAETVFYFSRPHFSFLEPSE